MINIFKLYRSFCSEYNTSQSGFFRPVTDFVPAIHSLSLEFFNKMGPEAYKTQQFADLMIPFAETVNIAVKKMASFDVAPYPKDYVYFASMRMIVQKDNLQTKCERDVPLLTGSEIFLPEELKEDFFVPDEVDYMEIPVRLTEANRWASVTTHRTKGPTLTPNTQRSFTRQRNEGFEIAPRDTGTVVLDYYRLPKEPVFNYTSTQQGVDRIIQFVEKDSQHLEWNEAMTPVFLYHLGKKYGMKTRDQLLFQVRNVNEIFEY